MREFDDVWVWNSNPGEAFKVKEGVFILKTPLGKYEVACKGDPCNTTWDCCIKMSKVPDWGLVPKDEPKSDNHVLVCGDYAYISTGKDETIKIVPLSDYIEPKKPEIKAGDLAYMDSHRFNKGLLRMVTGVNESVFCKYSAMTPYRDIVQWHKAELHTSAEDLEFMCNEAQVLSDIRVGKSKVGDEVHAWNDGDTGKHIGIYVNHTGSNIRPYQVKSGTFTGFFDNIKLHPNNAPTVEEQLDRALVIFDDGGSKSDTLANLLDMTLEGMKVSKLNAELEGNIMTAISISSEIADLKSLLKDIKDWV